MAFTQSWVVLGQSGNAECGTPEAERRVGKVQLCLSRPYIASARLLLSPAEGLLSVASCFPHWPTSCPRRKQDSKRNKQGAKAVVLPCSLLAWKLWSMEPHTGMEAGGPREKDVGENARSLKLGRGKGPGVAGSLTATVVVPNVGDSAALRQQVPMRWSVQFREHTVASPAIVCWSAPLRSAVSKGIVPASLDPLSMRSLRIS